MVAGDAPVAKDALPWVKYFDRPDDSGKKLIDVPPVSSPPVAEPVPETVDRSFVSTPLPDGSGKMTVVNDQAPPPQRPAVVDEVTSKRSAASQVFRLADGSELVQVSSVPRFYKDPSSESFKPIDASIVADDKRPGWLRSAANEWTASFGPIGDDGGVEVQTATGAVRFEPTFASKVSPKAIDAVGGEVAFDSVWPGVDVHETVQATGIKEDVVVNSSTASNRYEFALSGATAAASKESGSVVVDGRAGSFQLGALSVSDATGSDVTADSGVQYDVASPEHVAIVVNSDWLRGLSAKQLPITIDPTFPLAPASTASWGSAGGFATDGRVGKDSSGQVWRATAHFPYESYMNAAENWQVINASLAVTATGSQSRALRSYAATAGSYSGAIGGGFTQPPSGPLIPSVQGNPRLPVRFDVTDTVRGWFDANSSGHLLGLALADEVSPSSTATYSQTLELWLSQPPPATTVSLPFNNGVVSTLTPTIHANVVTDPDGDIVNYNFQVTTDTGEGAGSVVNSGWGTASTWAVPMGALFDGASYWVRVYTLDTPAITEGLPALTPGAAVRFKVDTNLGDGGPSPTDQVGEVAGVSSAPSSGAPSPGLPGSKVTANLVNGNVSVTIPTRSMSSVGGPIAPTLTYNSRSRPSRGLLGNYFADIDADHVFDTSDPMVLQRNDPAPNFSWDARPGAAVPTDAFLARWTGQVKVPASSASWRFGVTTNHGARVYVDNQLVTDDWAGGQNGVVWGTTSAFATNVARNIKVEGWGTDIPGNPATLVVYAQPMQPSAGAIVELNPSWLTNTASIVPDGWTVSVGAGGVSFVGLHDLGASVVVTAADGTTAEFKRVDDGGYQPPPDSDAYLTLDENNLFVLQAGGLTYRFTADGQVAGVASAVDDRHPAAPAFYYSGSPARPDHVQDVVSGRAVTFVYGTGGTSPCDAPNGRLCQINFGDGGTTTISYNGNGQIDEIANQGDPALPDGAHIIRTSFGYDTAGRLASVLDPLANEAISYGVRSYTDPIDTTLMYDSAGRISEIQGPQPVFGALRAQTTYQYPSVGTTQVVRAGFAPPTGWSTKVTYDSKGRIVSQTDAAGLVQTRAWDGNDRVVATTDPAGLRTTRAFDNAGRVTDTWGPAPASWFGTNNRPVAAHVVDVPHASTGYDEGIVGLAGVAWSNQYLAGNPALHQTVLSSSSLSADWGQTPPVPLPQATWSLRATGSLAAAVAGSYRFDLVREGAARLWIDDQLVVDAADGTGASSYSDRTLTAGSHRLRVEYLHAGAADASLIVRWRLPGGSTMVAIPTSAVSPEYGLATSNTDPDGRTTATEYAAAGIDPALGLATAQIVDPNGLALGTTTTYETPSSTT